MKFKILYCIFTFISISQNHILAQLVSNNAQLQNAITNATPGSTIVLADGVWTDIAININKNGTPDNPIHIKAETAGKVYFEGNSHINMGGSYISFEGVIFQNPSNLDTSGSTITPIIELRALNKNECNHCKITNIKIESYNGAPFQELMTFKWILVHGQYNEISYNSFIGKYGIGSIINDNRNTEEPDFTRIHHNLFADRTPVGVVNERNDQDAIRIGNSSTSLSSSYTEVYDNLFYNWSGEVEIISNKSGENKYYNNTFRDYQGTLTLRHGDNCEVFNNFFFAEKNSFSGGIRVIGEGHKVYNNYIEGVNSEKPDGSTTKTAGAINISNGRPNSALNGYFRVIDATIVNNTIVNCDYGFRIGTSVSSNLTQPPLNLVVANNIMMNTSENAFEEQTEPVGASIYQGNINQNGTWDLNSGINDNKEVQQNLLEDNSVVYTLNSNSPAIDASVGNYPFVTTDILGGNRSGVNDAGAEEFDSGGSRLPYTLADVGSTIGFGGSSMDIPRLSVNPSTILVNRSSGSTEFRITSNVDWEITVDADWLSLNTTSGNNSEIITATFTENSSNTSRTAVIFIKEIMEGNALETAVTLTQSNAFAEEIAIVDATAIGTEQGKDNVSPLFAWDDNVTNTQYWTGDANQEPEVSITFDVSCIRILSQIGLHILKANERTINFDIAVANSINGPFTPILTNQESNLAPEGIDEEQIFDLNNTTGRFIKFISNGNSAGSGFASIAEVNIYGDPQCDPTLGIEENIPIQKRITLYPNPTRNEPIALASTSRIGSIEVYDLQGRVILIQNIKGATGTIPTSNLHSGTYIIKSKDFHSYFVIH